MYLFSPTVAPDDYTAFPPPEQLPDSFTLARRRQCFDVAIMNDTIFEVQEQFTVTLINLVAQTNFPEVTIDPALATIIIEGDDGKWSAWFYTFSCQCHYHRL